MSSTFLKTDFATHSGTLPASERPRSAARPGPPAAPLSWLRERARGLLGTRDHGMELEFPERVVRFRGLREFEFALASRTDFPANRVADLMTLSPAELEHSAGEIRLAERRFSEILARSVEQPALVGEFLREVELKLFSQDHRWRDIMEGLVRLSPRHDAYKRVALVKYMQYLRSRQNILRAVFVEKTRDEERAGARAGREDATGLPHGDTSIFDLDDVLGRDERRDTYAALPKGETVVVELGDAREMELLLAGNRFRLYTGRDFYMVDDGGHTSPLRAGKNLVGRHSGCDVVVDSACRAVSRNHLIVEPLSVSRVLLTDLSSHGTEVPGHLLGR